MVHTQTPDGSFPDTRWWIPRHQMVDTQTTDGWYPDTRWLIPRHQMFDTHTTTTTTTTAFFSNVGIQIIARNSQNNNAVASATGTFSLQQDGGLVTIDQDTQFVTDGTVYVPISANGRYNVQIQAAGFITQNIEMNIACTCTSASCDNEKLVVMLPTLPPGQTRIMMTWEKSQVMLTHISWL